MAVRSTATQIYECDNCKEIHVREISDPKTKNYYNGCPTGWVRVNWYPGLSDGPAEENGECILCAECWDEIERVLVI